MRPLQTIKIHCALTRSSLHSFYPSTLHSVGKNWRHEDGSIMMFRHLLLKNNIELKNYGLNNYTYTQNNFINNNTTSNNNNDSNTDNIHSKHSERESNTMKSMKSLKRTLSTRSALDINTTTTNNTATTTANNTVNPIQYDDQLFIEEIISGIPEAGRRGRPKDKYFLYDIGECIYVYILYTLYKSYYLYYILYL